MAISMAPYGTGSASEVHGTMGVVYQVDGPVSASHAMASGIERHKAGICLNMKCSGVLVGGDGQ